MPAPAEQESSLSQFVAGLSVFFAMSYIVFVNPLILSQVPGISGSAVFFATCAVAGLGSLMMGVFARTPTALAPAMGLNYFFVDYLRATHLPWQVGLAICGLTGLVFLFLSLEMRRKSLRKRIIDALPPAVILAVNASIGAVLIDAALRFVRGNNTLDYGKLRLFLIGLAVIFLFDSVVKNAARATASAFWSRVLFVSASMGPLLAIGTVTLLSWRYFPDVFSRPLDPDKLWLWQGELDNTLNALTPAHFATGLAMGFVILYVLLADIVGTAANRELVPEEPEPQAQDRKVQRAFFWDSAASALSAFAGTTPAVCYGENIAGPVVVRVGRPKATEAAPVRMGGLPAVVVGIGFLTAGVLGFLVYSSGAKLTEVVPTVAIAPALFYIGIYILAQSLRQQFTGSERVSAVDRNDFTHWVPAAIAITLVPYAGLDYALGLGILSYAVLAIGNGRRDDLADGNLVFFVILAALAMVLKTMFASA